MGPNNEGKSNAIKGVRFIALLLSKIVADNHASGNKFRVDHSSIVGGLGFAKEARDLYFGQPDEGEISFDVTMLVRKGEISQYLEGTQPLPEYMDRPRVKNFLAFLVGRQGSCFEVQISGTISGRHGSAFHMVIIEKISFPGTPRGNNEIGYNDLFDYRKGRLLKLIKDQFGERNVYGYVTNLDEVNFLREYQTPNSVGDFAPGFLNHLGGPALL